MPSSSPASECQGPSLPLTLLLCRSAGTNSRIRIKNLTKWHSITVLWREHTRAHTLKQAHETMWSSLGFYLVEKRHFGMDDLHSALFSLLREMLAGCLCLSFHDFVSCSLFLVCFAKHYFLLSLDSISGLNVVHTHSGAFRRVSQECRSWFDVKSRAVVLTNWPMFRDKLPRKRRLDTSL